MRNGDVRLVVLRVLLAIAVVLCGAVALFGEHADKGSWLAVGVMLAGLCLLI